MIKDKQITFTPFFGKTKTFNFDYITEVRRGTNITNMGNIDYVVAYHEKEKLFTVAEICPGYQILVSRLKEI
jgi:hypothetical protein